MEKLELKKIFGNLQNQMISKLSSNREIIKHPGTKGSASELNWIEMLNTYLPKRYKVDEAFVLDSDGNVSEQIDIVVYDNQYSPFLFCQDDVKYIPAESVYAVFEVKQSLNKSNMLYACNKIRSVRILKRTSVQIIHAGGKYLPKRHFKIIGGILTLDCDWLGQIDKNLEEVNRDIEIDSKIEIGCALQKAGFQFKDGDKVEISKSEDALIFFFLHFLEKLQKLGTTPALDICEYGKFIGMANYQSK